MKSTQFLSTLLCLFLLLACTIISAHQQEDAAVLDIQGNKLQEGSKYYVVSAIWGAGGGGVSLSNYRNQECPTTVTQLQWDLDNGIPVTFHPAKSTKDGTIRLSKSLNVKFSTNSDDSIPACSNSTVWKVGGLDAYTRSFLITIGGEQGNPGCSTQTNWFKIEKGDFFVFSYKFSYNPDDVCSSDQIDVRSNQDISRRFAFGERPLALGGDAFNVVFIKYDAAAAMGIRNEAAHAAV